MLRIPMANGWKAIRGSRNCVRLCSVQPRRDSKVILVFNSIRVSLKALIGWAPRMVSLKASIDLVQNNLHRHFQQIIQVPWARISLLTSEQMVVLWRFFPNKVIKLNMFGLTLGTYNRFEELYKFGFRTKNTIMSVKEMVES